MNALRKYKGLIYLAGLLIVAPWFVYVVAIAGTVRTSSQLKQTEREIHRLQAQSRQQGTQVAVVRNSMELQNGDLIPAIMGSDAGSRCTVVKYTPYITESRDGLSVHMAELVISGRYADLLRLVEQAESAYPSCRLVSVGFKSIKQRQRKEIQLNSTMIFQQITNT